MTLKAAMTKLLFHGHEVHIRSLGTIMETMTDKQSINQLVKGQNRIIFDGSFKYRFYFSGFPLLTSL